MPQVVAGFSSDTEGAAYLMDRRFWITAFMYGIVPRTACVAWFSQI